MGALWLVYYVVNSGSVALVISLQDGRSVFRTWHLSNVEFLPQYLTMVVTGVMAAMLWSVTPVSIMLMGFVVIIIYVSFSLSGSLKIAQRDLLLRMKQIERRTAELVLLNEIGSALTSLVDLDRLWAMIASRLDQLLDFHDLFIAVLDAERQTFHVVFQQTTLPMSEAERTVLLDRWRRAIEQGHAFIAGGGGGSGPSLVIVPVVVDGRPTGVLCCRAAHPVVFSDEDQRFLAAIADQVAVALEHTRLRRQAAEIEAIEQLNRLKSEFISAVSHELRSPLTPIVAYAELLTVRTFPPDMIQQMAAEIHRQTLHLQRLVDDLLDISRMEAGGLHLEVQPLRLDEVIRQVIQSYTTSPQHQFAVRLPPALPMVSADPVRVRQVLLNLVSNAVKYSPQGGRITVTARERGTWVEVSVADQGIGIPPDKLERVFEKFYRVDGEEIRKIRGTGLGLAICKHIISLHGGRIWAESAGPGRGSTFIFTLPVLAAAPDERQLMAAGTGSRDNGALPTGDAGEKA